MGLSRQYLTTDGDNSGSQLLDALYDSGQIGKKVFSVHYDSLGSQLELGGYNSSKIAPGSALKFIKTPYAKEWQMSISGLKVGSKPAFPNGAKAAYHFESKPAYLDSFSPYIQVPKSGGTQLYALILHEIEYEVVDGLLMGPCDTSKYDSVSLFINDEYYFQLTPESFVLDIGQGDKCFLPFLHNNEDYWVLGEPFFRNYYSVYDVQKGLIGVAPSVDYPGASIDRGQAPGDELPNLRPAGADAAEGRKKLPDMNDPFSVIAYLFKQAVAAVSGKPSSPQNSDNNQEDTWTGIATLVSLVVLICSCCCLCAGTIAYFSYEGERYLDTGLSAS